MISKVITTKPNIIQRSYIQKRYVQSIGIRRENKSRWERRSPLTPDKVKQLINETGSKVYIQPSTKRIFTDESFEKAGAIVTEDLSNASIILGVKEVPKEDLLNDKTYLFFSHTHKGNERNMPMLQSILDKNIRLIDYELMKDETDKRLVAFGQFAGNAGMIDIFHGMGRRFLGLGYSTPFMYASMAHAYPGLNEAKLALNKMGDIMTENGTPKDFGPLVYAFTGSGNVTKGALDIFKEVPHEFVSVEDLPTLVNDKNPNLKKVYGVQLSVKDYIEYKDTKEPLVDYKDYLKNPSKYKSNFHHKIAPFTNCVVTGAYWDKRYPRLFTNEQLKDFELLKNKGLIKKGKMMSLADIVCDIQGTFECLSHATNIEDPFFYYDPVNNKEHKNDEGEGIQIMGVDILPSELPIESSSFFSESLYPYLKELVLSPAHASLNQLSPILQNAAITNKGKLTPPHASLKEYFPDKINVGEKKKTVLLLGSGMVSGPLVEHLAKRKDTRIVIASNALEEAKTLCQNFDNVESVPLDISDENKLNELISLSTVVVSFVPAFLHTIVANACIKNRKDMVTASYVSKEMEELNSRAQKSGILIMNEVGLDPGIDHMSAMKIIDEAKRNGSKITSFVSWCGGLPSPEASNVPLGYKFSWSPRGVLTASGNDAIYWSNGEEHRISGEDLLKQHFPVVQTPYSGLVFEGLANRNSLGYVDIYGLGQLSNLDTMFRGTLRYQGYSDLLFAFRKLGFLEQTNPIQCNQWSDYVDLVLLGKKAQLTEKERLETIVHKLGLPQDHPMTEKTWSAISFFLSKNNTIAKTGAATALDLFSLLLADRLKYNEGETDLVAMHHEFGIEHRSGQKETLTSTLVKYGNEKHTAMADTVGLPAAMAVDLVLDNKIPERGVLRPTQPHVYLPILEQLESKGIKFVEKTGPFQSVRLNPTGSNIW